MYLKKKNSNSDITHKIVDVSKQKKPRLNDILFDKNFEKLDEKHVYCHYCDIGKSITLHQPNDGDRLLTHINTILYINNKAKINNAA